ncbi:MAG TPA: hypothetical protein QF697_08120 [Candidatus Marinimicrobia bacterium]|nr:hypothetical protein [Candidatus Neomarinimicrobiota bacterium]
MNTIKHRLFTILITGIGLMSELVAQGPDDFPDAPTQGAPITGIAWIAIAGGLLFARKIRDQHKK